MNDEKKNSETARKPKRVGFSYLTGSRTFLKVLTPAVLGLILFGSGCESVSSESSPDSEKTKESQAMEIAQTRVNGYLSDHGTLAQLETELNGFGLSPGASDKLLDIVNQRNRTSWF